MNNISDDDVEFELTRAINLQRPTVIMLIIFGVIGVIGNAVILMVYWRLVKMTTTQFLIFVIAIFDFLTAIVAVPLTVMYRTYGWKIESLYYCKLHIATVSFFIYPGALLICIVTFIRYCHVCRPRLLQWIEPRIKVICVIIGIIALANSVVEAILIILKVPWERVDNQFVIFCHIRRNHIGVQIFIAVKFVILLAAVIALVIMNILIIRKNHKNHIMNRLNKEVSTVSTIEQEKEAKKSNDLNEFFEFLSENKSTNLRDASNDNNKEEDVHTSEAGFISDYNTTLSAGSNKTTATESSSKTSTSKCSSKSSVKKGEKRAQIDKGNCINCDSYVSQSTMRKKKTDTSFKGLSSTTVMLSIVSALYVISYLPAWCIRLGQVDIEKLPDNTSKYVVIPLLFLFFMNCCLNPVVYTFVDPTFRAKCRLLFRF